MKDMPQSLLHSLKLYDPDFKPYRRNPETLGQKMGAPGHEGLKTSYWRWEKENITGTVSTDP